MIRQNDNRPDLVRKAQQPTPMAQEPTQTRQQTEQQTRQAPTQPTANDGFYPEGESRPSMADNILRPGNIHGTPAPDPVPDPDAGKSMARAAMDRQLRTGRSAVSDLVTPRDVRDVNDVADIVEQSLQQNIRQNEAMTPEDMKKALKRRRITNIINAIADGGSAIANLIATHNYAPNVDQQPSLSGKAKEIYDQLYQREEQRRENYLKAVMALGAHRDKKKQAEAAAQQQAFENNLALWKNERETNEDKRKAERQPYELDKIRGEAEKAKSEAEWAPKLNEAKYDTERSKGRSYDAAANANNADAHKKYVEASTLKEHTAMDRYGNWHSFKSGEAALKFAEREGTIGTVAVVSEKETSGSGGTKTERTTTRTVIPVDKSEEIKQQRQRARSRGWGQ